MSKIGSYPTRDFSETQKFLVYNPETQSTSLVLGRDLVEYITPQSTYVFAEQSRAVAQNEDYQLGSLIQTAGDLTAGDNFAGTFLVVPGGDGDFPMTNGYDLLIIKGDVLLREQLASNAPGEGSDLIAHTGTSDTVTEALDKLSVSIQDSGLTLSPRKIADNSAPLGYDCEPQLVQCNSGIVVCVFRRGSDHVGGTGARIVAKRSTDNGKTWGAEIIVNDIADRDTRNPIVGVDKASGRLTVFSRTVTSTSVHDTVYLQTSEDDGVTWSAPQDINSSFPTIPDLNGLAPFGSIVDTANGQMALFYATVTNRTFCYALFSTDNGQTWGNRVTVWDVTSTEALYTEPVPLAVDQNRIVIVCRDNRRTHVFAFLTSSDGGLTWTGVNIASWFDTEANTAPQFATPIWVSRYSDSEVIATWGARRPVSKLLSRKIGIEAFFKNPWHAWWNFSGQGFPPPATYLNYSSFLEDGGAAINTEFGYPCSILLQNGSCLLAWYDSKDGTNTTETDIWVATAPA